MRETHLTIKDLAKREGVPVATVYRWNSAWHREERKPKDMGPRYIRVGRHVRYRLADVVAWENTRLVDGGDAA